MYDLFTEKKQLIYIVNYGDFSNMQSNRVKNIFVFAGTDSNNVSRFHYVNMKSKKFIKNLETE